MKEADILLGWQFPTKNIREIAPNLKWIHVTSAGVNHLSPFDWMKNNLILTNSSGVHSKKAGEFGLMSILMLQNQMTKIVTNQKNKEFVTLLSKPIDGFKVVVVGTGSLGGSMIKHVSKLGAEVIGVNRKGNDVEGCSKVITFDKLDEVLPSADFLYLAVPETEETKGLINKTRLDSLKSTCGIVNIGRHSVLDYKTLRIKLEKNEIAGAILDVFSHEPIPKDSYLWDTPNLIITPHISSDSQGNYIEMVLKIFFKNLKLFLEKKELINQIDRKLGY
jgi:phosphoglycerate dehydrogenase-like enzyme